MGCNPSSEEGTAGGSQTRTDGHQDKYWGGLSERFHRTLKVHVSPGQIINLKVLLHLEGVEGVQLPAVCSSSARCQ